MMRRQVSRVEPGHSLKRLLKRPRTYDVLRTVPSIVRGSVYARVWKDGIPEEREGGSVERSLPCTSPNPLTAYFDSRTVGKGIWKWQHYFDIYHRHFQKFVGKEVRVVEVGIYSGGSLDMWKAYFGPKCRVYGVDIEEACKVYEDDRTEIFIGDQGDRQFWRDFRKQVPDIDIVIDDGGHFPEQQIVTVEETLPYMRSGGVYLCEDVVGIHNRFAAYVHGLTTALNAFALKNPEESRVLPSSLQRSICSVHLYPFVVVVEKAGCPVDELVAPKHGTEWQPFFR
jgi:hypothetical protein